MITLDTHVLLWWTLEPARLSTKARDAIDATDRIAIAAIVFWEVALLARHGKVALGTSTSEWLRDVLSIPRVESVPLTPEIAVSADSLAMHADPADRFIVATAVHHQLPLVTKDKAIQRAKIVTTLW